MLKADTYDVKRLGVELRAWGDSGSYQMRRSILGWSASFTLNCFGWLCQKTKSVAHFKPALRVRWPPTGSQMSPYTKRT
jgi:hypothetical protein